MFPEKDKSQHQVVVIGTSTEKKRCVKVHASRDLTCLADAANHPFRKNTDGHLDPPETEFEVTVEKIAGDGTYVCAKRVDADSGWAMHLAVGCFAGTLVEDISSLSDGSWKMLIIDEAQCHA